MQHAFVGGDKHSLLQQHLATGKISEESLSRLDPSLVTSEMRSPPAHSHARLVSVVERLVYPVMQEQQVCTGGKTSVGRMFQKCRIFRVLADLGAPGECFGTHNPFAVYPCRFGYCIPDSSFAACPEFAHRDIGNGNRLE